MRRRRKDTDGSPGLNLTPVLGIVFLILLFFAVSVPLARERGVDIAGDCYHCGCWDGKVIITVDSRNRISIEDSGRQKQIDRRSVRTFVARRLAEFPKCSVVIQAHRQSDMGVVVRVFDEAKKARSRPMVPVTVATVDS